MDAGGQWPRASLEFDPGSGARRMPSGIPVRAAGSYARGVASERSDGGSL